MAPISQEELLALPQSRETWQFGVRELRTWIVPEGEQPRRPFLIITVNPQPPGLIRSIALEEQTSIEAARQALYAAMARPPEEMNFEPQRPARVLFEDRELHQAIAPALQAIGVVAKYRGSSELIDELVADLEEDMREDVPEVPGLLSQPKVNPKVGRDFFAAAADFYRAAPWVHLSNDDHLAVRVRDQAEPYFVTVMGHGGVEYGLALYLKWENLLKMLLPHDSPADLVPREGTHSLLFEPVTSLPFDDLEAIERYGWEVAGPQAYPMPVIFVPPDTAGRPDGDEIGWYTAALRAIPAFVEQHLQRDDDGEIQPVRARLEVPGPTGAWPVEITYPAGELPQAARRAQDFDFHMDDFEDEMLTIPDRRIMEGTMAAMLDPAFESALPPEVQEAQALMYQAWEEDNPARRLSLARKALKISADCADAYVLLAEEEADTVERALELYQQGVAAGRRALGEDYFEENAGHFWGLLETRPFMRAMEGMANYLWKIGRKQESLRTYVDMLHLNPGDNQGIRYDLVDLLLGTNRYQELAALLEEYPHDWSAVWQYTRALLLFREHGASEEANRALDQALEQNRHVPAYLTGEVRVPLRLPVTIGIGDQNEAAVYASQHLNYWRRLPGAVEWLKERVAAAEARRHAAIERSGFNVGESARVKEGVSDEEFGTDLSGWQGRISEIDLEPFTGLLTVLIQWDSQTLEAMPDEYIERCGQEDLDWTEMQLPAEEVLPAEPRDDPEDRHAVIPQLLERFAWSYLDEQGERIQDVVAGLPAGDLRAHFDAWERYLQAHLEFPFEAEIAEPREREHLQVEDLVQVHGLEGIDDVYGVLVEVSKQGYRDVVPLYDLEVIDEDLPQAEPVDDYLTWFMETGGD